MKVLICCSDLYLPFILNQLAESIHILFDKNDGDPYLITNITSKRDHTCSKMRFSQPI